MNGTCNKCGTTFISSATNNGLCGVCNEIFPQLTVETPCSKTLNEQVKSLRAKIEELELKLKRYDQATRTPFIKGGKCRGTTHSACDCVIKRTGELETEVKALPQKLTNIATEDINCEIQKLRIDKDMAFECNDKEEYSACCKEIETLMLALVIISNAKDEITKKLS